jgi:hypothetical protein|tara:strand:- start:299 stop:454 length:156 start_codon:yes stop_codon:yes gene_type:complete
MYSNEQRLFWRRGISMEGVGLGLVVGCTGSKESRWEGGKVGSVWGVVKGRW